MTTLKVNIINPKATKLLKDLEDLNLIVIRKTDKNGFQEILKKLRGKAKKPLSMKEITREVEIVRAKRNDK